MSAYRITAIALVLSIGTLGCKINANYCPGRNDNNNCTEPPYSDAAPRCPDEVTCTGTNGVCNMATGQCVMCTTEADGACMGNTPVCGSDNVCRGCTAHTECPGSEVCLLPTGQCSDGTDVAYVKENATGTACTKADPCPTISAALEKKPYIKVTGTIQDEVKIDKRSATILAEPGAKLLGNSGKIAIEVRGMLTTEVSIYDLEISRPGDGGIGISIPSGNSPTLSLHRAKITNNDGGGIVASGGTLNITQSTLSGNDGGGVKADGGGTLNIRRSTISGNNKGGVIINDPMKFEIVNNFVIGNGKDGVIDPSEIGGLKVKPTTGSKLEFNTIVGNKSATGSPAGGVYCDVLAPNKYIIPNNLIFDNTGGGGLTGLQISAQCDKGSSIIANPGANFRSLTDYHLVAGNPNSIVNVVSAVDCAGNTEDYDGEKRPQGTGCDLGADEYWP